ncbi:choice-of-anchor I family protein [Mangrovimonas aestuarii]|uniref:choice-of-anchor I family protein n=1 Tax=Mangrovimonas aestuarii TaxID=3018443 RepID=UPI002378FDA8|nr:choice-of-anchor I family protein [Mangrovimonas aestuarii]
MKKLLLLPVLLIVQFIHAQLNIGDMAFIAMNADADDDFAMVTFVDIPANTTVYFTDSEWDGSQFGTDENNFSWQSGAALIPAGTVITFSTISATASVSHGNIVGVPGGISGSSEAIFAFSGTAPLTPTTFIAAIANASSAYGTLENTGLIDGTTAITYPDGTDIGAYNGPRTGLDANGYLLALNNLSNYDFQDGSGDQNDDSIAPDVPFNATSFTISNEDTTAPTVATTNVTSSTTIEVVFSEEVTQTSAENISNYSFSPVMTISSITYDNSSNTTTITHSGLTTGTAYTLSVSNIEDLENNLQENSFTSNDLFYNNTSIGLIITEIMYNAPSDDSDALEFLEIYNNSSNTLSLGGIQIMDEGNFVFTFPEMTIASEGIVLLATDKTTADIFYGETFLDMPQGISNALGNGGETLQIINTENTVIFTMEYSDDAPWPTDADGDGPSLELLNPSNNFNEGTNWTSATNLAGQSLGENVFASPGVYSPVTNVLPQITFGSSTYNVNEGSNTVSIPVEISSAYSSDITVDVVLVNDLITADQTTDFTFIPQTLTISANTTSINLNILISDDTDVESDEMFLLELANPVNASLGAYEKTGVYITDNDFILSYPTSGLEINYLTNYQVTPTGSAEISAFDPISKRLFVLNSVGKTVEILNLTDLNNISTITSIDLSSYGTEGPTNIAYNNGLVAATVSNGPTADGHVVFMDINGTNISSVTVGNLPDMLTFSPDGTKLMVANEGQPNTDYSIDPEGSLSLIDVTSGLGNIIQTDVTSINFNAFNSQLASLQSVNVRIFGPGSTVSQDLEPEYITFSSDSQTAWVTLQENNAIAKVDLTNNTVTDILPLGLKDHSLENNTLDTCDDTDFIFMANWPVKGMYMPDAIAYYSVNGVDYVVTANEGDAREYDALEEEIRVSDSDYVLDPTVFPNAEALKMETNLGRLTVTNATGDIDNDGDFDEIHVLGSRSFSIWNATTGALVYDSGDDFERYTAADPTFGNLFNASNSNNNYKNRSDNKGPEPEGIIVAEINGEHYAFITLERVGGFMTYNVSNPTNALFQNYANHRDLGEDEGGDLGPEGIIYITPENSPNGEGLIILSNEVSATVSIYTVTTENLGTPNAIMDNTSFKVYPNPVQSNEVLYLSEKANVSLYDLQGRLVLKQEEVHALHLPQINAGTYILKTDKGASFKVVIK